MSVVLSGGAGACRGAEENEAPWSLGPPCHCLEQTPGPPGCELSSALQGLLRRHHICSVPTQRTERNQQGAATVPKYMYKVQAGSGEKGNSALSAWLSVKLYSHTYQSSPSLAAVLGLSLGALCPPHGVAQSRPDHTPPLPASNVPSTHTRRGGSDV